MDAVAVKLGAWTQLGGAWAEWRRLATCKEIMADAVRHRSMAQA